jgi:hypothetical protein
MVFDIDKFETVLGPRGTNAAFAVLGGLLSHLWSQFRARRIVLSWTANFQKISPQGSDPFFSNIQVLLHSQPSKDLYSCQITILNESPRDVDEFDVLFTFQNSYVIVNGQGNISTSAKTLSLSQGFQETVRVVQQQPEANRQTHKSYNFVVQNREFHLPSLNRRGSATFTFFIDSKIPNEIASVIVTTEKKGVKLVSRPAQPKMLGVPMKQATAVGIIFAILLVFAISYLALSSTASAFLGFFVGISALLLGILFIRLFRFLKNLFG